MLRQVPVAFMIAVPLLTMVCCNRLDPAEQTGWQTIGSWPVGLRNCLGIDDGRWTWRWQGNGDSAGTALLIVDAQHFRWLLDEAPPPADLRLEPDTARWLTIRVPHPDELAATPPLPRLKCDSDAFGDLVTLLRHFITPRFEGRVTHWPDRPIPVRSPAARSGGLDLAACLREAVTIWNQGASPFVWDDTASWGVRLAHYAGSTRSPPMQLQITRSDSAGRPLRARIAVGDDYDADERIYAVRAMAHELAHATLLWGHSPDREHLLWGDAPPLRADPSEDERRAAELLHRLPEGLDLNRYGRTNDSWR